MTSDSGTRHGGSGWRMARWALPTLLLAIPALGRFPWSGFDYALMGVLLFGSVGLYELAAKASGNGFYRLGAGIAVVSALLLIWINLAVGIIGSENNPLNLLYAGVIGSALIGAIVVRFEPNGMARAMMATAGVHGLVALVAVTAGRNEPPGPLGLAMLNGMFVAMWFASGLLFRRAADSPVSGRGRASA